MMPALRAKAMVHESRPEGALVYRKPPCRRADPRGDRRRRRARRLSEAARALAGGAPDILTLTLDADYASHEAFTRAFRDHFGVTPEMVRSSTRIDNLGLQEPIVMDSTLMDNLPPPRFETSKPLLVAGLGERYTWEEWRPRHSRPVAALSSVGGEYSRPNRKGGLRRLLQRRRRR
jgi:AraC-like DNA-binding protein